VLRKNLINQYQLQIIKAGRKNPLSLIIYVPGNNCQTSIPLQCLLSLPQMNLGLKQFFCVFLSRDKIRITATQLLLSISKLKLSLFAFVHFFDTRNLMANRVYESKSFLLRIKRKHILCNPFGLCHLVKNNVKIFVSVLKLNFVR